MGDGRRRALREVYRGSRNDPPPRRRDIQWRAPNRVWSGRFTPTLDSLYVNAEGGDDGVTVWPNGPLVCGVDDDQDIFVRVDATARDGLAASSRSRSIRVSRRNRWIEWRFKEVWEVGETITVAGLHAVSRPDGAPVTLVEPLEAFEDAENGVHVTVRVARDDYYKAAELRGTVKVVADRTDHAKSVAVDGVKDGTLWSGGGASTQRTNWNAENSPMKKAGQKVMSEIKEMTGDQLVAHLDGLAGTSVAQKQDERITKPNKQYPNVFWLLPDDLQVRYKPEGDGRTNGPMFCVEARTVAGFTQSQDDVAFKVSDDGIATPPGSGSVSVPAWVNNAGLYDDFMNAACAVNHLPCKPKTAGSITRVPGDPAAGVELKPAALGITGTGTVSLKLVSGQAMTNGRLGGGMFRVEATAAASPTHEAATEIFDLTVVRAPRVLTWTPPKTVLAVNEALTTAGVLNAVAADGGAVSYRRPNGNAVGAKTRLPGGDAEVVIAYTPQTDLFLAGEVRVSFTVRRAPQALTWSAPPGFDPVADGALGAKLFEMARPDPKADIAFSLEDGTPIDKTTRLPAGQHVLLARVAQTAEREAAEARLTVTVRRKGSRLSWEPPASILAGTSLGDGGVLNARAAAGLEPVYRRASGEAVDAATILPAGQHPLVVTTTETAVFNAGEVKATVTVARRAQTVRWDDPPNVLAGSALGAAGVLTAQADGGVPVAYTDGLGKVVGVATVLPAGEGQVLIARAAETAEYEAAEARVTVNVRTPPAPKAQEKTT